MVSPFMGDLWHISAHLWASVFPHRKEGLGSLPRSLSSPNCDVPRQPPVGITLPDPGTDISGAGWSLSSAGSEGWDCSAETVNTGVMWGKPGYVIHDPALGEAPEKLVFDGPFSYGLLTSGPGVCRLHTSARWGVVIHTSVCRPYELEVGRQRGGGAVLNVTPLRDKKQEEPLPHCRWGIFPALPAHWGALQDYWRLSLSPRALSSSICGWPGPSDFSKLPWELLESHCFGATERRPQRGGPLLGWA